MKNKETKFKVGEKVYSLDRYEILEAEVYQDRWIRDGFEWVEFVTIRKDGIYHYQRAEDIYRTREEAVKAFIERGEKLADINPEYAQWIKENIK